MSIKNFPDQLSADTRAFIQLLLDQGYAEDLLRDLVAEHQLWAQDGTSEGFDENRIQSVLKILMRHFRKGRNE